MCDSGVCFDKIVPAVLATPKYDFGPPTDLWVNSFAGAEKDCL